VRVRLLIAVALALPVWACAQTVRIEVFTLFHPTVLTLSNVAGSTIVIEADGRKIILDGERDRRSVMLRLDHEHLLLNGNPVQSLQAASRTGDAVDFMLSIPGRITRHYCGILKVTAKQHALEPVVAMDIETAVASVVAAESAPSTPLEAMKAQAVAARSFFHTGGHHGGGEFCDTTHCQFLREPPSPSSPAAIAARETRGLVLTWRGEPLAAMYSSRCGGRTKTLQEIGSPVHGYPYFAVECAYCRRHPYTWTRALSAADARGLSSSTSEGARLALDRVHGWAAIPSNDYQAASNPKGVTLHGRGQGHGLGLCQYGAAGMAADGADFASILRHYYPETELASIPDPGASR
jgi:stage II sporulation protein D